MASTRVYADFASGYTADTSLSASATTASSSGYAGLPGISGGQYLTIVYDPQAVIGAPEIVYVTGHATGASTCTIVRGCEGTTGRTHNLAELWVSGGLASDLANPRPGTAVPAAPETGQLWYDAAAFAALNVWSGSTWAPISPIGAIVPWAAPNHAPPGWLVCDGSLISRSSYALLFGLLGTAYGSGDGSTTFALPNLLSRVPVGSNNLSTNPLGGFTARAIGASGGEETHLLTLGELAAHPHALADPGHVHGFGGGDYEVVVGYHALDPERYISEAAEPVLVEFDGMDSAVAGLTAGVTGGGGAHNAMAPFLGVNWIIFSPATGPLLPDMVITGMSSLAGFVAGQSVQFAATVKNQGNGPTPTGDIVTIVTFSVDGTEVAISDTYQGVLSPGQSVTLPADEGWTATTGTHVLTAVVNPGNEYAELNGANNSASASFTVGSPTDPITWTLVNPAAGVAGASYSYQFIATNATDFVLYTGTLPPGLSLSSTGLLTGTPTTVGAYQFDITASNANPSDSSAAGPFTLNVAASPSAITWTSLTNPPAGGVGASFSYQFTATGATAYSVSSGSLPPGLALATSGVLFGTPTTAGAYTFHVSATNGTASAVAGPFTTNIYGAVTWVTSGNPSNATLGSAYSFTFAATNATSYALGPDAPWVGVLPTGMAFNASTGVLSGTPTTAGTSYPFSITASNGYFSATKDFTLSALTSHTYSPGGTYTSWEFPNTGYNSIEWTMTPVQDAASSLTGSAPGQPFSGFLHNYAMQFSLTNGTSSVGGCEVGFQTNGDFTGTSKGKVINFSFWGNTGGNSTNTSTLINPANSESGGYQLMLPYNWTVGHSYRWQITEGPGGVTGTGKWWGLTVTDETTGVATYVGEEFMPLTISGLPATTINADGMGVFGEDTHWWQSLTGSTVYSAPSAFQNSAMAFSNVTCNDGTVTPTSMNAYTNTGVTSTGSNGYLTTNAQVTVWANETSLAVQHNLGYWASTPPNTTVDGSELIF